MKMMIRIKNRKIRKTIRTKMELEIKIRMSTRMKMDGGLR